LREEGQAQQQQQQLLLLLLLLLREALAVELTDCRVAINNKLRH
jgi:hypothetical protein